VPYVDYFPARAAFLAGGSASALSLFEACPGFTRVTARRIAQLPKATFVTRLRPLRLPARAARQLPDQSTTLWVKSSSTSDARLRGALPTPDITQVLNKSGPRRIATGKCHRRRVVVRDASRRWGVNQTVLPPADESCKSRAEARRKPEEPELADICAAGEQRGASTTSWVDGRVCDRNQKQVDQS
jgi:hypothetical protein